MDHGVRDASSGMQMASNDRRTPRPIRLDHVSRSFTTAFRVSAQATCNTIRRTAVQSNKIAYHFRRSEISGVDSDSNFTGFRFNTDFF